MLTNHSNGFGKVFKKGSRDGRRDVRSLEGNAGRAGGSGNIIARFRILDFFVND
jgi:hypothetical protein